MAIQVEMGGLRGTPIGGHLGKFTHDQRFDVRAGRFLIVEICAHVSDVRVSQADNLAGVTGVGENFLISGEAGIENDFAAPARDRAGGAAIKYAPVFQRENRGSVLNFRQWVLPSNFCSSTAHLVFASVVESEPK
jgi:hypothetical protein